MLHLHDAELVRIETSRPENRLSLGFQLGDGRRASALCEGVIALRVVDFIPRNVISRFLISSTHAFTDEELHHRISWVSSLSDGSAFADEKS